MRRTVALVLVFAMMIPQRAYAFGSIIGAASDALFGDDQEEEEVQKNGAYDARQQAAEKVKQKLVLDGTGDKKLRLKACKTLAVAQSEKIEALDMQIDTKTARMQSAVRSLRERERSMQTVRWSPLLSIKFPETPKENEALEFEFKPVQLQNEITLVKHKIEETEFDIYEKVSKTYIEIITSQQEIDRLNDRYRKLQNTVNKLEIKVKDGTAAVEEGVIEIDAEGNEVAVSPRILKARLKQAQDRLEKAETRLESCKTELADARTHFEEGKQKLSTQIGIDCTTGYTFEDAFVTANLSRETIEYLYTYALTDDANVYEAQQSHDEAMLSLQMNYQLCKKKYPQYIGEIETYIQQALDGTKISKRSFKNDYDKFLKDIDAEWKGSYKIWFIKIPKEWLKGSTDGIRYVEDDPYVLYSAALDYESAAKELRNAKSDLHNQIFEEYSNYASSRKAYLNSNTAFIKAEKMLGIDEVRYLLGELSQEEFENEEDEFNGLKDDAAEALSTFSDTLYTFDRTTCGGLSKFLEGAAQDVQSEALSLVPVIRRGCIYTLRPIIDSEEFLLSVDVPDDFYAETGIHVTHFELICDGHKIGEKTEVGKTLRHLTLSTKNLGECIIRVYDGETFIDDCLIEPTVLSGPLNITVGYDDEANGHILGHFSASDDVASNMLVLMLFLDQQQVRAEYESGKDAAYYRLSIATDTYLMSDRLVPVNQQFTYLNFIKGDLAKVFLELYDAENEKIGNARFDLKTGEIYNEISDEEAALLAEKKRQEAIERAKQQEEDQANADAQAKREAAKQILEELGMSTDTKSIDYAMKHMNELSYDLELVRATESLKNEQADAKKKYEALKADPDADPKDLKAAEDRERITRLMPDIYKNTYNSGLEVYKDELEKYKIAALKAMIAEYATCYNRVKEPGAYGVTDVSADEKRMTEIETEVVEEYKSDAITVFKEKVVVFDEILAQLNALTKTNILAGELLPTADNWKKGFDLTKELDELGYGKSFKRRMDAAEKRVVALANSKLTTLKPLKEITIYNYEKTIKTEADDFYTIADGIKNVMDGAFGNSVDPSVKTLWDSAKTYRDGVHQIEKEREEAIKELVMEYANAYVFSKYSTYFGTSDSQIKEYTERMAELEKSFASEGVDAFKEKANTFDEGFAKLVAYTEEEIKNTKTKEYARECQTLVTMADEMVESYGDAYQRLISLEYQRAYKLLYDVFNDLYEQTAQGVTVYTLTQKLQDEIQAITETSEPLLAIRIKNFSNDDLMSQRGKLAGRMVYLKQVQEMQVRKVNDLKTTYNSYYSQMIPLRTKQARAEELKKQIAEVEQRVKEEQSKGKDAKIYGPNGLAALNELKRYLTTELEALSKEMENYPRTMESYRNKCSGVLESLKQFSPDVEIVKEFLKENNEETLEQKYKDAISGSGA